MAALANKAAAIAAATRRNMRAQPRMGQILFRRSEMTKTPPEGGGARTVPHERAHWVDAIACR
jgi:hypothetical protein